MARLLMLRVQRLRYGGPGQLSILDGPGGALRKDFKADLH